MNEKDTPKIPKELDAIADLVLAYKAKPKSAPGKQRKKKASKIAKKLVSASCQNPELDSKNKSSDN